MLAVPLMGTERWLNIAGTTIVDLMVGIELGTWLMQALNADAVCKLCIAEYRRLGHLSTTACCLTRQTHIAGRGRLPYIDDDVVCALRSARGERSRP